MIFNAEKKEKLKFRVNPPLFLPFYNRWGRNVYYATAPFCYNPMTLDASSTSGSPVVLAGDKFFGILSGEKCTFEFDGSRFLTVTLDKGESLYVNESCNPYAEWQEYNKLLIKTEYKPEKFWSNLEYCTWVEQAKKAALTGASSNQDMLDEGFIYDYLERLDKLNFPKGKFTIDDGWSVGSMHEEKLCIGDWEVDERKLPHFEKLVSEIAGAGYITGLWFTPFTFTRNCRLAKKYPELVAEGYNPEYDWYNIRPIEEKLTDYYRDIFTRYIGMGIRKLKLDISYGPKNEMIQLLKIMNGIIKEIDSSVEVETQIPDIFATRYADTVRINDVSFDKAGEWRYVNGGHYVVCRNSSPDRILNLDHIGTNAPLSSCKDFSEHFDMIMQYSEESGGYPTVSSLPDCYGDAMCDKMREGLSALYNKDGSRKDGQ